jgi:hypothetical protein
MSRRRQNPDKTVTTVIELIGLGGLGWILYEILTKQQSISQTGPQLANPASYGGNLSYLYSAVTGQPASGVSVPAQANVYSGPNAPAAAAGMSAFLASGHATSDEVPGTGQTVASLVTLGYTWDQINQAFGAADQEVQDEISSANIA